MYQKLALGGIGGLTPLLAVVLIADAEVIDKYARGMFDPDVRGNLHLIGYLLKAILLFSVGAFWAYLHRTEQSSLKIYQLGIVAPAMVLGTLTAHDARKGSVEDAQHAQVSINSSNSNYYQVFLELLISPANAQPTSKAQICSGDKCPSQWYDAVIDGFFARSPSPPNAAIAAQSAGDDATSAGCSSTSGINCSSSVDGDAINFTILKILRDSHPSDDLRLLPPSDSKQVNRARKKMSVPANETILGFVK